MKIKTAMTIRSKFKVLAWVAGGVLFSVTLVSFLTNIFLMSANNDIYEESTRGIESISAVQNILNKARTKEILAVSYAAVANMDQVGQLEQEMSDQKSALIGKLAEANIGKKMKDEIASQIGDYFETAAATFVHAKHYVTDEAS